MDRKLSISFRVDRSVEYHFSRNERSLSAYVIDHPAGQVELLYADPGYEASTDANGRLRLSWASNSRRGWSEVGYRKLDKLKLFEGERSELLSFSEDIEIKSQTHFGLWLGSRHGPLSAVKARSNATFAPDGGLPFQLKPRELEEEVFRSSGVLRVRWILERVAP